MNEKNPQVRHFSKGDNLRVIWKVLQMKSVNYSPFPGRLIENYLKIAFEYSDL